MSKARIIIEYNGRRYRPSGSWKCKSKRDCSLFANGVCNAPEGTHIENLPCDILNRAFTDACCVPCQSGFKEVK